MTQVDNSTYEMSLPTSSSDNVTISNVFEINGYQLQFIVEKSMTRTWLILQHLDKEPVAFFMPTDDSSQDKLLTYAKIYTEGNLAYGRTVQFGKTNDLWLVRTNIDGWLWLSAISAFSTAGEFNRSNVFRIVEVSIKKRNPQYNLTETAFPSQSVDSLRNFSLHRDIARNAVLDLGMCFEIEDTDSIGSVRGLMSVGNGSKIGFETLVGFESYKDFNPIVLDYVSRTLVPSLFQTPNGLLDLAIINVGYLQYNVAVEKTTVAELEKRLHEKASVFVCQNVPVIKLTLKDVSK
jgi:hypothetical protein